MSLKVGARFGSYDILSPLGRGGMGAVYRARDTKLGREVALKVLPEEFASDTDRLARFQREARLLATLNHANIAAIYGIEDIGDVQALVLELVEGPTLADRIVMRPIRCEDALSIAGQIADALAAAHEQGIVHRDLKPSNVKLRPDGTVKVLDFGLAKGREREPGEVDGSSAPTIIGAPLTHAGVILGTVQYMAPEQTRGQPVDKRADIWAFGCVLYEMLTGKAAFGGETPSDTIAEILQGDPDWSVWPADVPPFVRALVQRCLEKDRKRRTLDLSTVLFVINNLSGSSRSEVAPAARTAFTWPVIALLGLLSAAVLTLGAFAYFSGDSGNGPVYRSTILGTVTSDPTAAAATLALSPVGDRLAFIGDAAGTNLVYVRALDGLGLRPLAGTEGVRALFWSPDGRSLAFIAGNKLKTIDATGSRPALEIADAFVPLPGSWNRDGVILFTPTAGSPLSRVSAVGGPVTPVTTLDEKTEEFVHSNPSFLPDGRHFTYVAHASGRILRGVYIGSLESSERVKLLDDASDAQYGGNMLLYRRARTLMAQRFDAGRMRLTGPAVPVADGLEISEAAIFPRTGAFSISETGVLVYRAETSAGSQLQWLDRSGRVVGTLGDRAKYLDVMLSPGGTLASVSIMEPSTATRDLWVYDIGTGRRNRFTFDPEDDLDQRWSPDGQRIAFASRRKGHLDLYVKLASGAGSEDLLLADDLDKYPQSWSPDGRYLLYAAIGATTEQDLWVLPLTGVHPKPYPFVQTPYSEGTGQFSPDGRWIVYRSNEAAGRFQLYVTPFPSRAGKWQITTTGGTAPRWRSDGKEIFYEASGNVLTAMSISTSGGRVEVGSPRTLFHVRPAGPRSFYDASRDGQRFLVNTADEPAVSTSLTFVTNWPALLKQ